MFELVEIGAGYVYLTLPFGDEITVIFIAAFILIFGASVVLAVIKKLPLL